MSAHDLILWMDIFIVYNKAFSVKSEMHICCKWCCHCGFDYTLFNVLVSVLLLLTTWGKQTTLMQQRFLPGCENRMMNLYQQLRHCYHVIMDIIIKCIYVYTHIQTSIFVRTLTEIFIPCHVWITITSIRLTLTCTKLNSGYKYTNYWTHKVAKLTFEM